MRIWLQPDKLAKLGLTPSDVISAIKEQNLQAPAGRVGMAPSPKDQEFTYTVSAPGRLVTRRRVREHHHPRDRDRRADPRRRRRARRARLAGLQLLRPAERQARRRDGRLSAARAPTSCKASEAIYETMRHAKELFPQDMDYTIVYDTTPAVEASIESIVHTFVEAVILVTLVVFIFLQNFRATIIPLLTVPVSLIGTFIFFPMLGFSVNTLSMFGLVLAIGIVVDDAIVVVEAVMHHIEHGMSPKDATEQAMKEVSAPVIGIALILSRGVHSRGVPRRPHRPDVPAVRAHHRDLGAAVGLQRAVAVAGALGDAAQAAQGGARPARQVLFAVQRGVRPHHAAATSRVAGSWCGAPSITIVIVAAVAVGAGLFGSALAGRVRPR